MRRNDVENIRTEATMLIHIVGGKALTMFANGGNFCNCLVLNRRQDVVMEAE